jgi:class II lanthipeptide synthase
MSLLRARLIPRYRGNDIRTPPQQNRAGEINAKTFDVIRAWLSALGTNDIDVLARRLSFDGASLETAPSHLTSLLSPEAEAWRSRFELWFESAPAIRAGRPPAVKPYPFADLWSGVADAAMRDLADRLPHGVAAYYQTDQAGWGRFEGVSRDIHSLIVSALSAVSEPVLWAEFNLRRTPGDIVLAHLRAEDSETGALPCDIYCDFLDDLRRDRCRWLTAKYPALARRICATVDRCLAYSSEILARVFDDQAELKECFHLPRDAELSSILANLSDPHRGGKTVARLEFRPASGTGDIHYLAYKPKDLRLDQAFQELIADLPSLAPAREPLSSLAVLTRSGYGYMEWVTHRPCADDTELEAFYWNAGRLTAILHLLGASDCHHGNLIAHGRSLFLIDAETLFEGVPDRSEDGGDPTSPTPLQQRMASSVIRTGLLPRWSFVGRQRLRLDSTALGVEAPQARTRRIEGWVGLNSDGMIADEILAPAMVPTSLPVDAGSRNRLGDFAASFCEGFKVQLATAVDDKSRWIGDGGLLLRFSGCKRRFVPRATWIYSCLRSELLNPAALSSEAAQRLVLEELARSYVVSKTGPRNWPLFAQEVAQLDALDIPFFDHGIEDCEIELPQGCRFERALALTGYDAARRGIETLDRAEIAFQVQIVQGAIAAKHGHASHVPQARSQDLKSPEGAVTDCERRDEASAIGEHLVRSAISYDEGVVEWLGIEHAEDADRSQYGPLGPSLYGGRIGIALFLAALADRPTADAGVFRRTALAACSDFLGVMSSAAPDGLRRWWRDQPQGLAGSGGALLALLHMAELAPEFREAADAGTSRLLDALDEDALKADERFDIVLGCAGLIGPLTAIGTPRALRLAEAAGDHLVSRQDVCGGWLLPDIGPRALTGFSHGASGIAAALARLHAISGNPRQLEAAAKALRYERDTFDESTANWPDFRAPYDPGAPRFMLSWCHGAPGIAMSRLCFEGTALWDAAAENELRIALKATADTNQAGDSVCCGRFGRAAILRLAQQLGWRVEAGDDAARLERQALLERPATGAFSFFDVLGLFNGLSGVGLALLDSVAIPKRRILPSVLSAALLQTQLQSQT